MDQIESIASAINGYFDLMYDADDNRFPEVFHGACLVHGMRDGKLTAWSASEFRDVIRGRPSPTAMKSPREQPTWRPPKSACGSAKPASSII